MPEPRHCAECGAPLPKDAPDDVCPACSFRGALALSPSIDSERSGVLGSLRYFGDYELLGEIARGGMGVVFKARQVSLNRIVAIKMILAGQLASEADVRRFRTEAEAAANLQHPNIVAIYEVGEHEGQQYFSMEYIEGKSLTELLRDNPLPAKRAVEYIKIIAEAIHYAHQRGTLHRDLKPSNVLIDIFDQPRITDFGLAKQVKGDSDLTVTGQVLGSPNFMPPEQATGKRDQVGPHSDVYSLGAILYHLLTSRPPFVADTMQATLTQVTTSEPPAPRLLNPSVPRDLETICLKCLEKEPHKRYASAHELAEDLARFLLGEPIRARPVRQLEKVWRWCRRKPTHATAVLLVMLVAVGSPIAAFRINHARQLAEERLFVADLRQAAEAVEFSNFDRAKELLQAHRRQTGLLGFEWRYLWTRSRSLELFQLRGDNTRVRATLFSPDGRTLVSRSNAKVLKIWDLSTRQERFSVSNIVALGGFVPGESSLVSAATKDGSVVLIDLFTGRQTPSGHLPGTPLRMAARGQIALCRQGDQMVVRDAFTGAERLALAVPSSFWGDIVSRNPVTVSDDGQKLAIWIASTRDVLSVSAPGRIEIWSLTDGKAITNLAYGESLTTAPTTALRFSPDGTTLAAGGPDGSLTFWDVATWRLSKQLAVHEGTVQDVVFAPSGKMLATCSPDQTIVLLERESGNVLASLGGVGGGIDHVTFSPDGSLLASGNIDGTIRFWDVAAGTSRETCQAPIQIPSRLAFTADGSKVAVGCSDSRVQLFDTITLQPAIALSNAGLVLAASTNGMALLGSGRSVGLYNLASGVFTNLPMRGQVDWRPNFTLSADGTIAVAQASDATLHVWKLQPLGKITELRRTNGAFAYSFTLLPDGKSLIAGYYDGLVRWDFQSRSGQIIFPGRGKRSPLMPFISVDGKWLACVENESDIRLLSSSVGRTVSVLKGHRQSIHNLAFSPDGQTLASCSNDGTVRLWNLRLQKELAVLRLFPRDTKGVNVRVWDVAFSPDGNTLAAYTGNGTLKVWRATSWAEIHAAEKAVER